MSKPIEWTEPSTLRWVKGPRTVRLAVRTTSGPHWIHKRDASLEDVEKALAGIGLRVVKNDECAHGVYLAETCDKCQRKSAEANERDAAIAARDIAIRQGQEYAGKYAFAFAAKEAAEQKTRVREAAYDHLRPVVEAARAWRTEGTAAATQRLEDCLRTLDAGEAPQSKSPSAMAGDAEQPRNGGNAGVAEGASPGADIELECGSEAWCVAEFDTPQSLGGASGEIIHAFRERNTCIAELCSALARAEEQRDRVRRELDETLASLRIANESFLEIARNKITAESEAEKRETELRKERDLLLEASCDAADLESKHYRELTTIVERTAKAQRTKIADKLHHWVDSDGLFFERLVRETELVTLSTLPEADSSGGGEKTSSVVSGAGFASTAAAQPTVTITITETTAAPQRGKVTGALCRKCGRNREMHLPGKLNANVLYCNPNDVLTFDPAPPKSELRGWELAEAKRVADGEPPIVPAPDGGGEAKCTCLENAVHRDYCPMYQKFPAAAAEPKAEAIDEWTNCRCDEARTWSPSRWPHIFVLLDVIKRRNAYIAMLEADERFNLGRIADLTENLAAAAEQRACAVQNNAEWSRRNQLLETSDALARARCRELEAEIAALKSTTHQGE